MSAFIISQPVGVTPISDHAQQRITKVIAGDDICIRTRVNAPGTTEPATPDNSILYFALADQLFSDSVLWTGRWHAGIERVSEDYADDLIEIHIPLTISGELRRGSFIYSLAVADKLGAARETVLVGSLLVEYAPTSPQRNIPYKPVV